MMKRLQKWIIPLSCGLIVILIFRFTFMIGYVPSASMEPTIKKGSYVIGLRLFGELKRGDIIAFKRDGQIHVKRITAIPGDVVYLNQKNIISVNEPVETAIWVFEVSDDCFFVIGDNMDDSWDSRYWEDPFITKTDIVALFFIS